MARKNKHSPAGKVSIGGDQLQQLIGALVEQGYTVYGPTVRERAATYNQIGAAEQLPVGWSDEQDAGHYRLVKSTRPAFFDCVVGPHSWKRVFYPALQKLWTAEKTDVGFEVQPSDNGTPKLALIGVRPCELRALAIHDQILAQGEFADPSYRKLRDEVVIAAVNCTRPGGTCFCSSVGSGPKATDGFDLALTEIFTDNQHRLVIEIGSKRGEKLIGRLQAARASDSELAAAGQAEEQAAASMGRRLDTDRLKEILYGRFDHPHWEEIAQRCLTCGNCTMVCPTCFCVNVQDTTDLAGSRAERGRCWDSCFSVNFSYIHGGSIRPSAYARYRQWLMHKLAYWQDQFGVLGCVGCGRCITWCPVGIDITEEARALTHES